MKRLFTLVFALISCVAFAVEDINSGWLFRKGEFKEAVTSAVNGGEWEKVDLPHTFVPSGNPDVYRERKEDVMYYGQGWYTKEVFVDKDLEGKRLFFYFGAAYIDTDLYINGKKIGNHKGGYSAFIFEVTLHVKYGQRNHVAVRVDNTHTNDMTPLGGGYIKFGGITRPMKFIVKEPFCISPLHFASSGVYCKQLSVDEQLAKVQVNTVLNNSGVAKGSYKVVASIIDSNNKVVSKESVSGIVKGLQQWIASVDIDVKSPELWNGLKNPALYSLKTELYMGRKKVDTVVETIGFKSVAVDRDKGFFLNGESYPLRGVAQHEYYPGVGSAMSKEHYDKDMELMLDLGVNAIRLSHYPHAPYRLDLCDKYGIVAFSEMAFIKEFYGTEAFIGSCTQQVQEMVYQLYNHPSIAIWGLFNEIRFDTFKGVDGLPIVEKINKLAKEADPSRLTCGVSWMDGKRNDIADLSGWNRYPGWYWNAYPGNPSNFMWLDKIREEYPNRKLGMTEYSSGGVTTHFDEHRGIAPYNSDQFHPVDYFNYSHEMLWKALDKRPWLWGTYIWTLTEFLVPNYDQGRSTFVHTKGIVHEDREQKKDIYYFYKANWRKDTPVFHLAYKQYDIRLREESEVTVYSNLDWVELEVNGVDMGRLAHGDYSIYRWPNIRLKDGDNSIVVRSKSGDKSYEERAVWHHISDIHSSKRLKEVVAIESQWKALFKAEVEQTKRGKGTGVPGEEINSKFDINSTIWSGVAAWESVELPLFTKSKTTAGNWSGKMVYLTKEFEVDKEYATSYLYLLHTAKYSKANFGRISVAVDGIGVLTLEEGCEDEYRLINIEERLGKLKQGKHTISVIASTPSVAGALDVGLYVDVK